MGRRREDYELEKVTLFLFKGEFGRLKELHPRIGASKIVRDLVHAHLNRIDTRLKPHSTYETPIDL